MPANLTQKYRNAEQAFRQAQTPDEELEALQFMLRELPKHKGTDKLQADLKQKISRAKLIAESATKVGKRSSFRLPRQGAGRVVLLGGPNAGKSQLLKTLTRAEPEVAPYPFTTHQPAPGMMAWEDVFIQLVDTPPITPDHFDPATQGLIRGADLVLFLVDVGTDDGIDPAIEALSRIQATKTQLGLLTEFDETDIGVSRTRTFLIPSKIELDGSQDRLAMFHEFYSCDFDSYSVSAVEELGLEPLRNAIFAALDVVRIYTKMPNRKEPDYEKPFTIKRGGTLLDVAQLIHKDLVANFKHARVWGSDVHDGTIVRGDYVVHDRDVVEIHS